MKKIINPKDISRVNYTEGSIRRNTLMPLGEMFSDNIGLYYRIPEEAIANNIILQKQSPVKIESQLDYNNDEEPEAQKQSKNLQHNVYRI